MTDNTTPVPKAAHTQTVAILASMAIAAGIWLVAGVAPAILVGLIWLVPIIVAIDLGASRDRKGWMWGLILGWLGVLILACMRPRAQ